MNKRYIFEYVSGTKGDMVVRFLNELEPFKNQNPTAENISRYFYAELSKIVNTDIVQVKSVKLWETDRSAVKYME